MAQTIELLQQASALLQHVVAVDRITLSDAELVELIEAEARVDRLVNASSARSAGELAERSRFELGSEGLSFRYGHRKPVHFIEQLTRVSQAESHRRIRVGLATRTRYTLSGEPSPPEYEGVAAAMTNGVVGIESAAAIIACLRQARLGSDATIEELRIAERELVEVATSDSSDLVWNAGRAWRDRVDPDGAEPRYEDILSRTGVVVGRQVNGIKHYHVKADPISSAIIDSAMAEGTMVGAVPRFLSKEDAALGTLLVENENGELIETIVDPRSVERRRFDGLVGVLTAGVRATHDGPADTRTISNVNATVSLKDLQSDPMFRDRTKLEPHVGYLDGSDEVLPISAIQQMACDSGFTVTILGAGYAPLALGLRERSHNRAQRRAIAARDGDRCIAPGCRTTIAASHVHHVVFWSAGGSTDVDNGVFLCPAHHRALHMGAFEIRMFEKLPHIRLRQDRDDPNAWKRAGRSRQRTLIGVG